MSLDLTSSNSSNQIFELKEFDYFTCKNFLFDFIKKNKLHFNYSLLMIY
jgi:hypothetical protein